jgi:hypothetical protein
MKHLTIVLLLLGALVGCESDDSNPEVSPAQAAGRISETALTANFLRIRKAASTYRSLNGAYPDTVQALIDDGHIHPGQELDPWGTPFALRVEGSDLIITSYGADKKPGGEDENRDRISDGVAFR